MKARWSTADAYLQQLIEEGEHDSAGRITLDPKRARQKLAEHRFFHFAEGLLALISASLMAEATQVRVQRQGRNWQFLSDGDPPQPTELEHFMRDLFSGEISPALRELGLAINSLYPKHCQSLFIELESDRVAGFENGDWTVHSLPWSPEPPFRQRIVLRQHPSRNPLWEWVRQRWISSDDLRILKVRTRWSPVPVSFPLRGGWASSYELDPPQVAREALALVSVISGQSHLKLPPYQSSAGLFHWQRATRARSSLRCALLPGDPQQSSLLLVYRGLTLANHKVRSPLFRFEGVLNTESLDLDASRQHIVPNQRLAQRAEAVKQWVHDGAAAWIRSLEPQQLSEPQRTCLRQAMSRLTPSGALKNVVAALGPFPLIPMADGKSWLTLDELRASLEQYEFIHYAANGPAYLHERPLLSPKAELIPLKRVLKTRLVDASPFAVHFSRDGGQLTKEKYAGVDWLSITLKGHHWEALVRLPQEVKAGNRLVMRYHTQPFWASDQPLYEEFPCCFGIFVNGRYGGSFHTAVQRVLAELRQGLAEAVEQILDSNLEEVRGGALARRHDFHYSSLLCLWATWDRQRPLPPRFLEYPVSVPSPRGDQVASLAELMARGHFEPGHPASTLSRWLESR